MKLNDISILSLFQRNMGWLVRNHDVIAQNIANSDTPEFKAKELKPLDFDRVMREAARPVRIAMTSSSHLTGSRRTGDFRVQEDDDPLPIRFTPTPTRARMGANRI